MSKTHVQLDGVIAGRAFETALAVACADPDWHSTSRSVVFQLENTTFIDPYSIQLLISYICRFERAGSHCSIDLPKKKEVRDFMRVWGVDYAFQTACNRSLYQFCDEADRRQYFGENDRQSTFDLAAFPKGIGEPLPTNGVIYARLRNAAAHKTPRAANFFAFHVFDPVETKSDSKVSLANLEKRAWQQSNTGGRIQRSLGIDRGYLSSRIIFEALFNALRHSDATVVQTASLIQKSQTPKSNQVELFDQFSLPPIGAPLSSGTLSTHYWDDGQSMLDVFAAKLNSAPSAVRLETDPDFFAKYRVTLFEDESKKEFPPEFVDSNLSLTSDMPDHMKLLATIFPHVSSAHDRPGHAVAEEVQADDIRLASTGMGLYLLVQTAVKIFGGAVTIRSGEHFVEIKSNRLQDRRKDKEQFGHDFNVTIHKLEKRLPKFLGNLISARIPFGK